MQRTEHTSPPAAWWAWRDRGYTALEADVLMREGFTLDEPPTAKELVQVRQQAAYLERQ